MAMNPTYKITAASPSPHPPFFKGCYRDIQKGQPGNYQLSAHHVKGHKGRDREELPRVCKAEGLPLLVLGQSHRSRLSVRYSPQNCPNEVPVAELLGPGGMLLQKWKPYCFANEDESKNESVREGRQKGQRVCARHTVLSRVCTLLLSPVAPAVGGLDHWPWHTLDAMDAAQTVRITRQFRILRKIPHWQINARVHTMQLFLGQHRTTMTSRLE